MGSFTNLHRLFPECTPLNQRLVLPSQRLGIYEVLKFLAKGDKEPRQPHDSFDDLVAESLIAGAVFDKEILPVLTDILSARPTIKGPTKLKGRAADKGAEKVGIDAARFDEYKASGKIHFGAVCDIRRSMQPVGTMTFIKRASDMFQGRGVLTIHRDGGPSLNIVIVDVENGFVKKVSHKPNLMRINLKLAVPIRLKDGTETFHVLEHKMLLKASLQNEKDGMAAWHEYRALDKQEGLLIAAFDRAVKGSSEAHALEEEFNRVTAEKMAVSERRAAINARDHVIPHILKLAGTQPESTEGSVREYKWVFTPLEEVVKQMKAQQSMSVTQLPTKRLAIA